MRGLGTIVNMLAIIAGGIAGDCLGSRIGEDYQKILLTANGLAVIFIGAAGVMEKMLVIDNGVFGTQGTLMMIVSLSLGAIIGEFLKIESRINTFGEWLRNQFSDAGDTRFVQAFVTSSCTVCIGAMAVVGSIADGISADHSILFAKSLLDLIIIMALASSLGKGCIFSSVPVGILQGSVTVLASLLSGIINDSALNAMSLVGSVLIFCVGVNLVFDRKIPTANLLPSVLIALLIGSVS